MMCYSIPRVSHRGNSRGTPTLSPIPAGFGTLLKEVNDRNVTSAWLELAWKWFDRPGRFSLVPDARNQVVEATIELLHEEGIVIEGLEEYLPAAWAAAGPITLVLL